jgi:membrane protein implicated in regulation of membrane protease activity
MIGFMLLAASVGFLLGFAQLRATVLLPAFFVLLISVGLFSVTANLDGWQTLFAAILGTVGLQVGYFVAVLERFLRQDNTLKAKSSAFGLSRFLYCDRAVERGGISTGQSRDVHS